jgi:hypothetical protein
MRSRTSPFRLGDVASEKVNGWGGVSALPVIALRTPLSAVPNRIDPAIELPAGTRLLSLRPSLRVARARIHVEQLVQ